MRLAPDRHYSQPYRHTVSALQQLGHLATQVPGRVDYDAPDGSINSSSRAATPGTDGIIHTGIGPFDMTGVNLSYGTVRYSRGAFKANFFTNILDGDANALLALGVDGQPIPFQFDTQTYDFEPARDADRHATGAHLRGTCGATTSTCRSPLGNSRTEVGGYIQDEIFLNDKFRFNVGARVDKFANLDDAVFSPGWR